MSQMTLADLAEKMAEIDFTMLMTRSVSGDIAGRPMSNNGDVTYAGESFFFTYEQTHTVADIRRDPKVTLVFSGGKSLFGGRPGLFINVEGTALLSHDKGEFAAHWAKAMDDWFPQGIDTPGIVLIRVQATRIAWWKGEEEGELVL